MVVWKPPNRSWQRIFRRNVFHDGTNDKTSAVKAVVTLEKDESLAFEISKYDTLPNDTILTGSLFYGIESD